MSLGTGAFKVGWGPEHLRNSKEVSMATLREGTTLHAASNKHGHTEGIHRKILSWSHIYQ